MTITMRVPSIPRTLLAVATFTLVAGCAQAPADAEATAKPAAPPMLSPTAGPIQLKKDHPQRYVVQPGDTLWDISARFLHDPWRWREIWRANPQVQNPHLIYPGDTLEVFYEKGEPRIQIATLRPGERPLVKLSPQVRVENARDVIPTVPREAIGPFLKRGMVVNEAQWKAAPYLLGGLDGKIVFATGDRIYARGALFDDPIYQIFRPGEVYEDPDTEENLGTLLEFVGEARLENDDDPATFTLISTQIDAQAADRLFPIEDEGEPVYQFELKPAPVPTEAVIIDSLSSEFLIGRYQTVVLDAGFVQGLEPGHVLKVLNQGDYAVDPLTNEKIRLPNERAGLVMIYKVFNHVAFGLVMEANRPIRIGDQLVDPES